MILDKCICHKHKIRYQVFSILICVLAPKTRVKLSSNPDYINANWIRVSTPIFFFFLSNVCIRKGRRRRGHLGCHCLKSSLVAIISDA